PAAARTACRSAARACSTDIVYSGRIPAATWPASRAWTCGSSDIWTPAGPGNAAGVPAGPGNATGGPTGARRSSDVPARTVNGHRAVNGHGAVNGQGVVNGQGAGSSTVRVSSTVRGAGPSTVRASSTVRGARTVDGQGVGGGPVVVRSACSRRRYSSSSIS